MDENKYTWVDFYKELADKLLSYKEERSLLVNIVRDLYKETGIGMPTLDEEGAFDDIDPFTFYGLFNKGISDRNRIKLLEEIKRVFDIKAIVPNKFLGIPVLNNQNASFYQFKGYRAVDDIDKLWNLFDAALLYDNDRNSKNRDYFVETFNEVKDLKGNRWKLTMGLYWMRPEIYINLDKKNRKLLETDDNISESLKEEFKLIFKKNHIPDGEKYLEICETAYNQLVVLGDYSSFISFSNNAEEKANEKKKWIATDYDSGLTTEDWISFINDPDIFYTTSLEVMKRFKDIGGEASCSELASKYGETFNFYNNSSVLLAKRIYKKIGLSPRIDENGEERFWSLLYTGRYADKDEEGVFIWKLRDELSEALDQVDLSKISLYAGQDTPAYWLFSPGEGASNWDSFYTKGIMGVGWDKIGNFSQYKSIDEVKLQLKNTFGDDNSYAQSANMIWAFANEIKQGDIIFAKKGLKKIVGYGVVTSDFIFDEHAEPRHRNMHKVEWKEQGDWEVNDITLHKIL